MLSLARNQKQSVLSLLSQQLRWARARAKLPPSKNKNDEKSEWWIIDGEMHEIGDNVPPRERFVIPRDNIPNKRRKQMREQFMRRTRLVLKESEHEPWCKRYMELYQGLRENWERLYWDEGYSKKIAQDHANYESAEDDDLDFSPYRRHSYNEQSKGHYSGGNMHSSSKAAQVRDKFEYDRERRMREKAFAPMNNVVGFDDRELISKNQPFDAKKFFPNSSRDGNAKKIAQDHANYESAEDDDLDFPPYRRHSYNEQSKGHVSVGTMHLSSKAAQIREKFEYDRERSMREKAFSAMNNGTSFDDRALFSKNQTFDAKNFFPNSSMDRSAKKITQDHANYESAEDGDIDFSPYRRHSDNEQNTTHDSGGNMHSSSNVAQIRDRFDYDREE